MAVFIVAMTAWGRHEKGGGGLGGGGRIKGRGEGREVRFFLLAFCQVYSLPSVHFNYFQSLYGAFQHPADSSPNIILNAFISKNNENQTGMKVWPQFFFFSSCEARVCHSLLYAHLLDECRHPGTKV